MKSDNNENPTSCIQETDKMENPSNYKEYKKEWDRKMREKAKQNKDKEAMRNMNFFVNIIRQLKLNYRQVAELTGISQQLISFWITTDDVKLSRIIEVFDKMGMTIECSFTPLPDSKYIVSNNKYSIEIKDIPNLSEKFEESPAQFLNKIINADGKLKFLAQFISDIGIGLKQFCDETGYQYFTVYQWLAKDDIKVSKIYDIAEKAQQTVNWKLSKKETV